ncbi:MAG: hypothetical protein IJL92_01335 [Thermoguttaceae bacterium]|nr:hypothetical protein [Thermoguttaceae bacterium]
MWCVIKGVPSAGGETNAMKLQLAMILTVFRNGINTFDIEKHKKRASTTMARAGRPSITAANTPETPT